MKRNMREEEIVGIKGLDMAKCLVLLSCGLETKFKKCSSPNGVFECKTCNRRFPSFQALGGHRASHKRPRTQTGHDRNPKDETKSGSNLTSTMNKPKTHECSICGLEFSMGQALGGHMRRHRTTSMDMGFSYVPEAVGSKIPVLKRSSSKRVMFLDMDLNLTPLENDLKLLFGKMAPKVDAFIS